MARKTISARKMMPVSGTRLAATLATLGLLGVIAWADEPPPIPPPAPLPALPTPSPNSVPVAPPGTAPSVSPAAPVAPAAADPARPNNSGGGTANGYKFFGPLGKELTVTGNLSVNARNDQVSGGEGGVRTYQEERQYQNGFGTSQLGPFNNNMDLTIQGKVLGVFAINARLSNQRYGNYFNQNFGVNYKGKGTTFDLGDVNAALPGNALVTFSKTLQGLMFSRDFGDGKIRTTGVASLTRAVARRGTLQGNDSRGPYYLNASSIIEGTDRFRLNGVDLVRDQDYVVDYYLGQVRFNRIITPADTVEFSYEGQNYNATPGILTGMRWDFAPGGGNTFGVTYLTQKSTNRQSGTREIVERFPVVADPTNKYPLAALIEPGTPVEVKWLDETLIENVDYLVSRELHFVQLKRLLPPDTSLTGIASLQVRYRPVRQSAVGGDRSVMGLDTVLRLGQNGSLAIQHGQSKGVDGAGTGAGTTMSASFKGDKWNLTTGWEDIGAGFSTIDSVSGAFLRARKGLTTSLSFAPSQFVNFSTNFSRSRVAQQTYGLTTTAAAATGADALGAGQQIPLSWATNATWNAALTLNLPALPSLSLNHSQVTQTGEGATATRSLFLTDSLNLSYQAGIVGLSGSLGRTTARGSSVFGNYSNAVGLAGLNGGDGSSLISNINSGLLGGGIGTNDSSSNTARFQLSLTPTAWMSLTGSLGVSRTSYGSQSSASAVGSATKTDARDTAVGVSLTPWGNLSIQANLSDATNGQNTQAIGNTNTIATGTAGSALTSGGLSSFASSVIAGQRTRTSQLSVQYAPISTLSFNFNTNRSLSLIPGYDNTESDATELSATLTAIPKLQLSASLLRNKVLYIGDQGNADNRSLQLTATAGPFGNISITSSFQQSNNGSALFYGSGAGGVIPGVSDGGISTRSRQTTGAAAASSVLGTNSLTQRENLSIWSTRVDYPVGGGRTLFLQWTSIDRRNPLGSDTTYGGQTFHTSSNSRRSTGTLGLDVRLNEVMGLTFDTNLVNLVDRDNAAYSYKARSVNMDLSARF